MTLLIKSVVTYASDEKIIAKGYCLSCVVDSVRLSRTSRSVRSNVEKVAKIALDTVSPEEQKTPEERKEAIETFEAEIG